MTLAYITWAIGAAVLVGGETVAWWRRKPYLDTRKPFRSPYPLRHFGVVPAPPYDWEDEP